MRSFVLNFFFFLAGLAILGEIYIRVNHLTIEVPRRMIDESGIQKYKPGQSGYWKNGNHQWHVNTYGWVGDEPESMDNLISIIGDSHIENLMNPMECHQGYLLKKEIPDCNFFEAARAGVTFIEMFEIAESLNKYNPKVHLFYVKDSDFTQSINTAGRMSDVTQLDIQNQVVLKGTLKSTFLKNALYNSKLLYYLYNESLRVMSSLKAQKEQEQNTSTSDYMLKYEKEIDVLLKFCATRYGVENKILIFHPKSFPWTIERLKKLGFKTIVLEEKGEQPWSLSATDNSHWTCFGHKKAVLQIVEKLKEAKKVE